MLRESGDTLGRYALIKRLAGGGMGEVFLAATSGAAGLSSRVALKVLRSELAEDASFVQMMIDEARISMFLNHQNIVSVLDFAEDNGDYYLAMEYVQGTTVERVLEEVKKHSRSPDLAIAVYIGNELCRALKYAHGCVDHKGQPLNIIHRDVTPANVLLSIHGEVKLTDFGIARAIGRVHQTQAGMVKGKFGYLAPEMTRHEEIDSRADLFSLGILLYTLCAGDHPIPNASIMEAIFRFEEKQFPPPSKMNGDIPPVLDEIIMRALEPQPADRWQSAQELAIALQEAVMSIPALRRGVQHGAEALASLMRELVPDVFEDPLRVVDDGPTAPRPKKDLEGESQRQNGGSKSLGYAKVETRILAARLETAVADEGFSDAMSDMGSGSPDFGESTVAEQTTRNRPNSRPTVEIASMKFLETSTSPEIMFEDTTSSGDGFGNLKTKAYNPDLALLQKATPPGFGDETGPDMSKPLGGDSSLTPTPSDIDIQIEDADEDEDDFATEGTEIGPPPITPSSGGSISNDLAEHDTGEQEAVPDEQDTGDREPTISAPPPTIAQVAEAVRALFEEQGTGSGDIPSFEPAPPQAGESPWNGDSMMTMREPSATLPKNEGRTTEEEIGFEPTRLRVAPPEIIVPPTAVRPPASAPPQAPPSPVDRPMAQPIPQYRSQVGSGREPPIPASGGKSLPPMGVPVPKSTSQAGFPMYMVGEAQPQSAVSPRGPTAELDDEPQPTPAGRSRAMIVSVIIAIAVGTIAGIYTYPRILKPMLKLVTDPPGAHVLVNGRRVVETTPISIDIPPHQAQHVEFELSGFKKEVRDVSGLDRGQTYQLHVDMQVADPLQPPQTSNAARLTGGTGPGPSGP